MGREKLFCNWPRHLARNRPAVHLAYRDYARAGAGEKYLVGGVEVVGLQVLLVRRNLELVREVQHHPITNRILHVDFFRVDVLQRVKGEVPIPLLGEAPAVRIHHGILMQTLHTLSVECLPMEMPERVEIDISGLEELEQGIRVSDYIPSPGITVLSDSEELIVRVGAPRVAEEEVTPMNLLKDRRKRRQVLDHLTALSQRYDPDGDFG